MAFGLRPSLSTRSRPDVGRGHRGFFTYGLFSFVNPRPSVLPRGPSSPTWSACWGPRVPSGPLTPVMLLPCTGSTPRKCQLFSRPCAVCPPRCAFWLRLRRPRPQFCKASLVLLYCPRESKSSRPASTWTITRPTPLPLSCLLCHPTSSLSRTLRHASLASWPRCPPLQRRAGVSNSSDRLSLALGASHCPLNPSAAGAAVTTDYQLTLSLPPDHCPHSFLSANPFSFCDVCPTPSILGDLALSHLLQAAFLDFQVRLRPLCPPSALGLLLVLAVITVVVWSFATFLITGDSALTLSCVPVPALSLGLMFTLAAPGSGLQSCWASPLAGGAGKTSSTSLSLLVVAPRMEGSCLLTKVNALSNGPSLVSGHLAESAGTSSRPLFRVTRSLENVAEGDRPTTGAIVLARRGRGQPRPIWTGQGSRPQPLLRGPAKTLGAASLVRGECRWRPQGPGGASGDLT